MSGYAIWEAGWVIAALYAPFWIEKQLARERHERCLKNIARMERDLDADQAGAGPGTSEP